MAAFWHSVTTGIYFRHALQCGRRVRRDAPNSGWVDSACVSREAGYRRGGGLEPGEPAAPPSITRTTFQPNIIADTAIQTGAQLTLRGHKALSYSLALGGANDGRRGLLGTSTSSKYSATWSVLCHSPRGRSPGASRFRAGTSGGIVPDPVSVLPGWAPQRLRWLRRAGVMAGSAYWLGRARDRQQLPGVPSHGVHGHWLGRRPLPLQHGQGQDRWRAGRQHHGRADPDGYFTRVQQAQPAGDSNFYFDGIL
jgi:hypothetical protein